MHILIIPSYYPSPSQPLTGVFIEKQALALKKVGHKVGVLVTPRLNVTFEQLQRDGLQSLRALIHEVKSPSYNVYRMHWGWFPRPLPPVVAFLITRAGTAAFERYCREQGTPDVLYSHNTFYGGYLASRIRKRYGVPAMLLEHSSSFLEGLVVFPGQAQIVRKTLRGTDKCFVVGRSLVDALHRYAPEVPIEVLGNVVDTDFFVPPREPLPEKPFVFTVIAQLKERRKGFDVLIDGFSKAFGGNSEVKLYIRGSGPLKSEIESHVDRLNLQSQVAFLPYLTLTQLRDLIWQSHVIVCSSDVETFAVSIAEGMACGKPVVATVSGGPEDYVNDDSGILVPPRNPEGLAQAMQRVRAQYASYDPIRIRQICVDQFSEQALVERFNLVCERIRERK